MRASHAALGLVVVAPIVALRPASSAPSRDPASGPLAVRITASGLNVRSAPATTAKVLGLAGSGQVYVAIARSGEWYKLWFNGAAGWAHGSWLVDDSSPIGAVTASELNVRADPGTSGAVIGTAYSGERFAIRGSSGGWYRIDFGGRSAWVSSSYVSTSGGAPTTTTPTTTAPTTTTPTSHPTSSAGYIQLPPSGTGFFCHGVEARRWGTPRFVYGIERVARRWASEHPSGTPTRFGIGDVSAKNGGKISGHASHQKGVDADFALPRNDGRELPRVDRFDGPYSRAGTQKLVNLFRGELSVTMIFFNDSKVSGVQPWPNHDNHFHVRIK